MKKLLLIFILLSNIVYSQVPCPNDNTFWLDLTPTGPGNTQSSSCTYAGDYDTFTATTGFTYSFSICGGSYNSAITMYSGVGGLLYSQNNTAGNGCETFTWTSTYTGVIRLLVDRANCGTNSICTTVSITQTSGTTTPTGNVDCSTPTQVCNDQAFTGNSNGFGVQDLNATNQGCLTIEHQSSWYTFTALTSGTVALNITTLVDYDFAIWGPNVTCGALGIPIRCSFAAGNGNTGLGNGAIDNSETAFGDRWVSPLSVIAGQSYIILIDNFTANSTAFTLDWTMSGGASLDCSALPIELIEFNIIQEDCINQICWITLNEPNNDYFELEKSLDGINFKVINKIKGNTNSTNLIKYLSYDKDIQENITYYRLKQVDIDGKFTYSNVISQDYNCKLGKYNKILNLLGQEVTEDYKGVKLYIYNNRIIKKLE